MDVRQCWRNALQQVSIPVGAIDGSQPEAASIFFSLVSIPVGAIDGQSRCLQKRVAAAGFNTRRCN